MSTCKDCIHERVCFALIKSGLPYDDLLPAEAFCMTFRNKADYVEVVFCKDCKHLYCCSAIDRMFYCRHHLGVKGTLNPIEENPYCSYGERKAR